MRLILHNLKKGKGQFVSFGVMILLTALILHIALVLASQTSDAYDRVFDELNTAQVNVLIPCSQDEEDLLDELKAIGGVETVERHAGVYMTVTVREFAGSDFDMNTVFYSVDEARTLSLLTVSDATVAADCICIPAYIARLGGFSVGESIIYQIEGEDLTFPIGATVSEMQYGNYGTGVIGTYMPQEVFDSFAEKYVGNCVSEYSLKTAANADLTSVKQEVNTCLRARNIPVLHCNDRDTAKQTRTMVCDLLILIFLALAFIILLVSLFLSGFRIRNSIRDEMTSMGVLKAIGYTGNGIITGVVVPYAFVGWLSALVGVLLSHLLLPPIADFLAMQSGFSYTPVFDVRVFLASVWIPTLLLLLFSFLSARKIRFVEPIRAIRGIADDGDTVNRLPLAETKGSVKAAIVCKQIVSAPAQNLLLFVLTFGIMILLSFAGTLFYNVNLHPANFMDTLSEESPSVIFTAKEQKLSELKAALEQDGDVSLVLEYATVNVGYADGSLKGFVCEDFARVRNDICYQGRNPETAEEIAIGSALEAQYPIGSRIELTVGEVHASYTVTGYVQSINNGGNVCELTSDGYAHLDAITPDCLNVYLEKGVSASFIEKWETEHGEWIRSSLDYEKLQESGQALYAGIVSAVTALLFVLSVLVVLLVMYIMIGSMLSRRKQEFGIYKAIGWSNRQLVTQSAMCFVPVIALSALLSAFAGLLYMPLLNNTIFRMLGAMKNHFETSVWVLLLFAFALVLVSYLICVLLSRPIKKITAYSLLKDA